MGDRISIRFVDGADYSRKSATLFSHWDGTTLLNRVERYLDELYDEREGDHYPIDRKEPDTVLVDFIRDLTTGEGRIKSNYYLVPTPKDGDNSDNGHYDILLFPNKYKIEEGEVEVENE
jgi:hypothetical protein